MLSKHSYLVSKHFSAKFPLTSVRLSVELFASCAAKITRMSKHGIPGFPESCLKITCKKYSPGYRYYNRSSSLLRRHKTMLFCVRLSKHRQFYTIQHYLFFFFFGRIFCCNITRYKNDLRQASTSLNRFPFPVLGTLHTEPL